MNFMRGMAGSAAAACVACTASASIVSYDSNPGIEGLGSFSGSTEWTHVGGDVGVVVVTLTNTSAVENGGYLTGFAFNVRPEVKIAYDEALTGWDSQEALGRPVGGAAGAPRGALRAHPVHPRCAGPPAGGVARHAGGNRRHPHGGHAHAF